MGQRPRTRSRFTPLRARPDTYLPLRGSKHADGGILLSCRRRYPRFRCAARSQIMGGCGVASLTRCRDNLPAPQARPAADYYALIFRPSGNSV